DSLYTIALREYGNAAFWRKMAEFNGLHPSAPLAIGQPIKLPTIYDSGRMIPSNAPAPPQPIGIAPAAVALGGPAPGGPGPGGLAPAGVAVAAPNVGGPIQANFQGQGMLAPPAQAAQGFAPQGLPAQGPAPQGFAPQGLPSQGPGPNLGPSQPAMPQLQAPQQLQQPSVPVQSVS